MNASYSISGPSGLGALSLQKPPCGDLPAGIRCCESDGGGWGGAGWGVITHACEGKASEGNEVWRTLPSQRVVPPSTLTPIPLPLCLRLLTRVAPSPSSLRGRTIGWASVGALDVAPTPVAPAKRAPRAASSHFITLHQIKSNKLITNDCGHASSKYGINIIDLILSMLSEKLINAWDKITAPFSRATATTRMNLKIA